MWRQRLCLDTISELDLRSHKCVHEPFGVFSAIASPEALFRAIESGGTGGPVFIVRDSLALSNI